MTGFRAACLAVLITPCLCFAETPEEPTTNQVESAESPLRFRMAMTQNPSSDPGTKAPWQVKWDKFTRSLLDMEDDLHDKLAVHSQRLSIDGARNTELQVSEDLRVAVSLLERNGDLASVRLRVEDATGRAVERIREVWIASPDHPAGRKRLDMAKSGEVILEDLSVTEGAVVHLYMGDDDVMVIWIDEEAEIPASP